MKRSFFWCITVYLFSFFAYSEEIRHILSIEPNGESLCTYEYENEDDGLIKREFYGNEPIYRLECDYFDNTNSHYIKKIERFNFDNRNSTSPLSKMYFTENNETQWSFSVMEIKDGVKTLDYYYQENNSLNLQKLEYVFQKDQETISTIKQIFDIRNKKNHNTKSCLSVYNFNNKVTESYFEYFDNEEKLIKSNMLYLPPEYETPYLVHFTYANREDGLLQDEIKYDKNNNCTTTRYYDSSKSIKGYSRSIATEVDNKLKSAFIFFDHVPYQNIIYSMQFTYSDNGYIINLKVYDKNQNEILITNDELANNCFDLSTLLAHCLQ